VAAKDLDGVGVFSDGSLSLSVVVVKLVGVMKTQVVTLQVTTTTTTWQHQ